MAPNQLAGPQAGYIVVYNENPGYFYPAIITAVAAITELVELTTFPPGLGAVDQQNVRSDPDGIASGTWRFLRDVEATATGGFSIITESGVPLLTEDGLTMVTEDSA